MKAPIQRKPADSQERDSSAQGSSTLSYVEAPSLLSGPGESGSGVRKIEEREPARDGQLVGPYRLLERIGEGAMGYVYRAEHTLIGRVVGIKMLRAELTSDEACVRRFLAEARAVNLIKHPHVIDVTDFSSTPQGQPWFVMELLEGSDLSLAASSAPLSLRRKLEIVRQLCEALAAVHAAGIVHRDVKPENIFLREREGQDFVTLLDFGIARLPDPVSADPLQEGLMGTSYYMAPEQASASPIDHRADLYAVGSTLFELVAGMGRTPFRAEHLEQQLVEVMTKPAPRLSDRASVPFIVRHDLDRLVRRLLAKDPNERPSSASEVAEELAAIAQKLEMRRSSAPPAIATPRLDDSDAIESQASMLQARSRARRAAREDAGDDSAVWAILLAALAAAAAIWIATREANWTHVVKRALSGEHGAQTPSDSVHVVEPKRAAPVIGVPEAEAAQSAPPSAPPVGARGGAVGDDGHEDRARPARRARRATPRPQAESSREPEASATPEPVVIEPPVLTIEPAPPPPPRPPEPKRPAADERRAIDRDVVLNPFDS